jgi:hypothetical protein
MGSKGTPVVARERGQTHGSRGKLRATPDRESRSSTTPLLAKGFKLYRVGKVYNQYRNRYLLKISGCSALHSHNPFSATIWSESMLDSLADIDVDDLLKMILILVIVWFALEIVDFALGMLLGPLKPLIGLVVLALLVLWFVDVI